MLRNRRNQSKIPGCLRLPHAAQLFQNIRHSIRALPDGQGTDGFYPMPDGRAALPPRLRAHLVGLHVLLQPPEVAALALVRGEGGVPAIGCLFDV